MGDSENTSVTATATRKIASRDALDGAQNLNRSSSRGSHEAESRRDEHVPHSICMSIESLRFCPGLIAIQTKAMAIVLILSRAFRISNAVFPSLRRSMACLHYHFRRFPTNREHPFLEVYRKNPLPASCLDSSNLFRPKSDLMRLRIWRRKAHCLYQRGIFAAKCSEHTLNSFIRTCPFWICMTSCQ
jgi:hypothetical protein